MTTERFTKEVTDTGLFRVVRIKDNKNEKELTNDEVVKLLNMYGRAIDNLHEKIEKLRKENDMLREECGFSPF